MELSSLEPERGSICQFAGEELCFLWLAFSQVKLVKPGTKAVLISKLKRLQFSRDFTSYIKKKAKASYSSLSSFS